MMPARELYQGEARRCVAAAETMHEPAERAAMLGIAQSYMKLADHVGARGDPCEPTAERNSRRSGPAAIPHPPPGAT
jgi:hypothetical protein